MSIRILRSAAIVSAVAAAAFVPAIVSAAGAYHPSSQEEGVAYHPAHASKANRGQVTSELSQAMKHPSWNTAISRGAPWPVASSGEPKTRAQVNAELQAAMKSPAWNSVSRGAPWPPASATVK
ncbi:MAG: DUF4148 domain-containing protein [Hyphomicrobiales bacterium]|nr:MAG: DUF4148 domain-containing protein [Hyphomicrobiales bacterium]